MNKPSSYTELYNWSVTDPTSFWQDQAKAIYWQTPFHTVCDFINGERLGVPKDVVL